MSSHEIFGTFACSLAPLLDEDYAYLQEKYIAEESLRPVFGDSPNKRKPHNGKYEWENFNAD